MQGNEKSRLVEGRQEDTETEMGRWDKTARNWLFGLCERFKKRFSLNPVNYILKMVFKEQS